MASKRERRVLDGTPEKRLFWSIIADYDVMTALCELVDNAVDRWWSNHEEKKLHVGVALDLDRQLIVVEDNAGGVGEDDLRYLITPGGSKNDPAAEIIGVFGVGSKRAAVALAETISKELEQ
jgi:sensor histidine kinase regulating citrate/malate metabolism